MFFTSLIRVHSCTNHPINSHEIDGDTTLPHSVPPTDRLPGNTCEDKKTGQRYVDSDAMTFSGVAKSQKKKFFMYGKNPWAFVQSGGLRTTSTEDRVPSLIALSQGTQTHNAYAIRVVDATTTKTTTKRCKKKNKKARKTILPRRKPTATTASSSPAVTQEGTMTMREWMLRKHENPEDRSTALDVFEADPQKWSPHCFPELARLCVVARPGFGAEEMVQFLFTVLSAQKDLVMANAPRPTTTFVQMRSAAAATTVLKRAVTDPRSFGTGSAAWP